MKNERHNTHILSESSSSDDYYKEKDNSKMNSSSLNDEKNEEAVYDAPIDKIDLKELFNILVERTEKNNSEKSNYEKS